MRHMMVRVSPCGPLRETWGGSEQLPAVTEQLPAGTEHLLARMSLDGASDGSHEPVWASPENGLGQCIY